MDDLSGLDWSSKPGGPKPGVAPMNPSYPSLRPTPSPFASGRTTPLSAQPSSGSGSKPQPQKAAADSFSNLMNFSSTKSSQNLSLAERQAQLEAEKRRKAEEQKKQVEAQFGNGQFWDTLGSGRSSAKPEPSPPAQPSADDDDLFAAFNKDTKVDKSSHYPPPESQRSSPANNHQLDLSNPSAWGSGAERSDSKNGYPAEDDDPFGLNEVKLNQAPSTQQQVPDDDDFLGDLARPVEEVRRRQQESRPQPGKPIDNDNDSSSSSEVADPPARQPKRNKDPFDLAVAQLVDYGFSAEDARRGLVESGAGYNAEVAVNWLLDDAHRKSKAKAQGRNSPASSSAPPRRDNRSPAQGDQPDLAKSAAAMGNTLFKTANSLWKTSQKKVQKAVAEFQQEGGDPSQPKWMRDAQMGERQARPRAEASVTDEAMMLEAGARPQPQRTNSRQAPEQRGGPPQQRSQAPAAPSRSSPVPRWQQQSAPPAPPESRARRLVADDDLSSYSSPNRRRKQAAPVEKKEPEPEPDLLFGGSTQPIRQTLPSRPATNGAPRPASQPAKRPSPAPRPSPRPERQVPAISSIALQNSTKLRQEGTAHFKRGDYASAHASYSSSLQGVPPTHPLAIVLLTNRALTALKTGEPKQAVNDADTAIKIIGPGNGAGETVAVRGENGQDEQRDMKELYGKALSRKAEALEQMERWADAAGVWHLCVEAGVGGLTAVKGRQRCQTALAPKPKPAPKPAARPRPAPTPSSQKSSEAVSRLRQANQAAAKEDDEKFELSEKVDVRVSAWRDGKRDNLRALLGSLDNVLWEGSGWKKVGLHELVMANKVKISYMKAIAKTHPDKVSSTPVAESAIAAIFSVFWGPWCLRWV